MTTSTPNLGLVLYNSTTDSAEYFSNFRAVIAGTSLTSNFYKIDTAYGSMQTEIDDIQAGAYFTLASYISANYYEATVTGITAYNTEMKIILSLNTASTGTVTLNINSLGIKSVMKINSAGTPVNISAGELMVGKYYFFAYDGTRWVWVDSTSADQLYIAGTSGNVVTVNSDNTLLGTTTQSLLISSTTHSAASKTTPVDADEIPLIDSAASNVLKSLTWANLKTTLLTHLYTIFPRGLNNYLINGGFDNAQTLGSTPTTLTTLTNKEFGADMWQHYAENASWQYAQASASGVSGLTSKNYGQWKKITNAGKGVFSQIIESQNSIPLRGKTLTFQIKMSASSSKTIRIGFLELNSSGTEDTPAALLSAYGANTVDPTWGTNLAVIGTPVSCSVTTSMQSFSVTATVPSNSKNVVVVVWTDSQFSINDILYMGEAGVFISSVVQPWNPILASEDLYNCYRYFQAYTGVSAISIAPGMMDSTSNMLAVLNYFPKRTTPDITLDAVGSWTVRYGGGSVSTLTVFASTLKTNTVATLNITATGTPLTLGQAGQLRAASSTAYLWVDSRIKFT